jgi:hypothetical protein
MRSIVRSIVFLVLAQTSIAACIHEASEPFVESEACDNVASQGDSEPKPSLLQVSSQKDRPAQSLTESSSKKIWQLAIDDVFLYDHLPKAGGSFVRGVLAGGGSEGKVLPATNVRIREESETLTAEDRQRTFTVGSVRDPCDYYVSCWSFSRNIPSVVATTGGPEFYGISEQLNTTEDIARFGKWLRNTMPGGLGPGLLTARFLWSYFNESVAGAKIPEPNLQGWSTQDRLVYAKAATAFDPSSVDCWIRTETLTDDMRECLSQFEERAGPGIVNWAEYEDIVERREQEHAAETTRSTSGANIWTKNSGHQPTCFYYDKASADLVFNTDKEIFEKFGYPACCA